jgi:hypothetical protein
MVRLLSIKTNDFKELAGPVTEYSRCSKSNLDPRPSKKKEK